MIKVEKVWTIKRGITMSERKYKTVLRHVRLHLPIYSRQQKKNWELLAGIILMIAISFSVGFLVGREFERKTPFNRSGGIQIPLPPSESLLDAPRGVLGDSRSGVQTPILGCRTLLPLQIPITVTAYNAESAQTDSTPNIGAYGDNLWALRAKGLVALAVSRDLEAFIPPGTILIVADRMAAEKRNQIDIHFVSRNAAIRWGVQRGKIILFREGE